jgi:hypothetical protein
MTEDELAAIEARARSATESRAKVDPDNPWESLSEWGLTDEEGCLWESVRGDNGDVLRLVAEVRRLMAELDATEAHYTAEIARIMELNGLE